MTDSARAVRRLLKALFTLGFDGPRGHPLIASIADLRALYDKRARHLPESIDGTFAPIWSGIIEGPDRARALRGFETAILFELRKALRKWFDLGPFQFVLPSSRTTSDPLKAVATGQKTILRPPASAP
jgi:hypothetical protein